ncbi:hypothetical protein ABLE91_08675 [Aquabacter sp. CN5-332]|uniref:hypothetical protein n=1 Tax=Aquabacter sp. CN5-332 TaxID=3156608 RepID=UPI0032B593A0
MTETHSDAHSLPTAQVVVSLDPAVAIVLLDLLGRMDDPSVEPITEPLEHPAERAALWTLRSGLEVAVGEPLADDYDHILEEARAAVVARLEGK